MCSADRKFALVSRCVSYAVIPVFVYVSEADFSELGNCTDSLTSCIYVGQYVGFNLSQATKTLKESRGIALLYFCARQQKGVRGQRHAPATTYPLERPGTHFTGGWVGLRAGLDRCGKSHPHRESITGPSSPQVVAIPSTLIYVRKYK